MRTHGAALLLASLLLVGCGEETAPTAADPTTSSPSPSEPSMSTGDPVQRPSVVAMVSQPDAGGRVSATPVPVADDAALSDFADQFEGRMARELSAAAAGATVPEGQTLLAAVVDISCMPPLNVHVAVGDGGVAVHPVKDKPTGRGPACQVPVTTVALVTAVV